MKLLLCFASCLFFIGASFAQGVLIKRYSVENGLPSNHIYTSFQDSKGYIWLVTTNGVSRFDGIHFTNYTSNNGLPDNDVFEVAEDPIGRIWISCYNGEPCYIKDNKVYTSIQDPNLNLIEKGLYFKFFNFQKKLFISQSNSKCYEVDNRGTIKRSRFKGYTVLPFEKNILSIWPKYLAKSCRYYLVDSAYKKTDSLCFNVDYAKDASPPISCFYSLGKNAFIIGLKKGRCKRYKIENSKLMLVDSLVYPDIINSVYSHGNKLWINRFGKGLIPLKSKNLEQDSTEKILFENVPVQTFMVDREGNYWACTAGEGLLMIPNNNFSYYTANNGLPKNDVQRLAIFDNDVYIGLDNLISKYTLKGFQNWPLNNPTSEKNRIIDLYSDQKNIIAATHHGLIVIDKHNNRIKRFNKLNTKCMTVDTGRCIWLGTHCRRYLYSLQTGNLIDSIIGSRAIDSMKSDRNVAMHMMRNGDLLTANLWSLFRHTKNRSGQWQKEKTGPEEILKNVRISCIESLDSLMVIGTVQKGLILICQGDHECVKPGNGITGINCRSLFIEKNKTIWVASFSGVFKIQLGKSIHSYTVQNINKFNGLLSNEVNDVAVLNNTVFAAGPNGLSIFNKNEFTKPGGSAPGVYINNIRVNGTAYGDNPGFLSLPTDSNNIELHFSAIDFRSLGHILFRYRIKGITDGWHYSSNNFVRFESLAPGDYRFEVAAMNSHGAWSERPDFIRLHIQTPWWLNSWFIAFEILLGIVLVYVSVKHSLLQRHRKQMHDNFLKRHVTELELQAIKAQINPHFIFNTLNAIQYFIVNNKNEQAGDYLERMASLLRNTLDYSNKTSISIEEEITYLQNYLELEKLRFDEQVDFSIRNNLPANAIIELPPMILQPHIENALRHGLKNRRNQLKKLEISFSLIDHELICEVSDNGVGRNASAENKTLKTTKRVSMGMQLSHDKLRIHEQLTGKKIKMEVIDRYMKGTSIATGTTIKINISQ